MDFLRIVYNFTYRLSGNAGIAEALTEKVLLMHPANHNDVLLLLTQAWAEFIKYYGCLDFKEEDPIQQALLSLSSEIRCAVILRDILGFSYGQIGTVLNKSDSEVARLILLGRQEIAKKTRLGARHERKPNIAG